MSRHIGRALILCAGLWLVSGGWARAEAPATRPATMAAAATRPDLSTPASAVAAFTRALREGDAGTLKQVATGSAEEQAWLLASAAHLKAFRELEGAITARYGKQFRETDAGRELMEQIEGARDADLLTDLKTAKIQEPQGDEAVVVLDETLPADRQGQLARVEGKWKMDLGSLGEYIEPGDAPALRTMAAAAAGLAKEVAAGRFGTAEEAATAIDERLTAAEEAGAEKAAATPLEAKAK
jgi:hypothetical protein